jgi:hypothetical protein
MLPTKIIFGKVSYKFLYEKSYNHKQKRKNLCNKDRGSRDRMVVGFTTTYAASAYHH